MQYFEELTPSENKSLEEISTLKNYTKGNILFYEGEAPQKLHLLLSGIVKVYKLDPKGNEVLLHFFNAKTFIAETAHIQKIVFPATAICETGCSILEIDFEKFKKEFFSNPEISLKFIESLSKKNKALQDVINMNLSMNSLERICKFLYDNEAYIGELSHKKIATILNIKPETFSRNLSILKKENVISVENRKIIILQKEKLHYSY